MCPTPQLRPAAEPKLWDLLWQMQRQLGEQNLSLPQVVPIPICGKDRPLGWVQPRPSPYTLLPPGSKVGLGEAEDQSGLWDQSVQRCFFCAHASSMLALGSEAGRASQDTAPRLELGLGRGAPGSGKYWTRLRNNSGGGNGSQRFLQTQEARGFLWRYLGAWLPQHPYFLPQS